MIKIPCEKGIWVSETQVIAVEVRTRVNYHDPVREIEPYIVWFLHVQVSQNVFNSYDYRTETEALEAAISMVQRVDLTKEWFEKFVRKIEEIGEVYLQKEEDL